MQLVWVTSGLSEDILAILEVYLYFYGLKSSVDICLWWRSFGVVVEDRLQALRHGWLQHN